MTIEDIEAFEDYLREHGVTQFFLYATTEDQEFTTWDVAGVQYHKLSPRVETH